MKVTILSMLALALGACGPPLSPDTIYDDGNQNTVGCPIPSTYQGQPGQPGDPCSSAALDCAPACCICPSGLDSYWASECSGGACTPYSIACSDAPSASLCQ